MAVKRPTDDDRVEAIRRLLLGLVEDGGADAADLVTSMFDLHPRNNTFPGEVFMELAADVLELGGITRANPIPYENLVKTYLPELEFRGKQNRRIQYAVLTSACVHGGLEPDLLDEVVYWNDDYWCYATYAAIAMIRVCADRESTSVEAIVRRLADRHGVQLAD